MVYLRHSAVVRRAAEEVEWRRRKEGSEVAVAAIRTRARATLSSGEHRHHDSRQAWRAAARTPAIYTLAVGALAFISTAEPPTGRQAARWWRSAKADHEPPPRLRCSAAGHAGTLSAAQRPWFRAAATHFPIDSRIRRMDVVVHHPSSTPMRIARVDMARDCYRDCAQVRPTGYLHGSPLPEEPSSFRVTAVVVVLGQALHRRLMRARLPTTKYSTSSLLY